MKYLVVIIFIAFLSCGKNNTIEKYPNGNTKSIVYFINDTMSHQKNYYKDGNLKSEGNITSKGLKIGKWDYFNINRIKSVDTTLQDVPQNPLLTTIHVVPFFSWHNTSKCAIF